MYHHTIASTIARPLTVNWIMLVYHLHTDGSCFIRLHLTGCYGNLIFDAPLVPPYRSLLLPLALQTLLEDRT